jgi:hypothetical protein
MTDRLNALELEILDVLRMDPETAELLTEMVAPESGPLTEDEMRSALERLSARGLVRPLRGWAAHASSAERVEASMSAARLPSRGRPQSSRNRRDRRIPSPSGNTNSANFALTEFSEVRLVGGCAGISHGAHSGSTRRRR